MSLIVELKKEYMLLTDTLADIKNLGAFTEEGKSKLILAKNALLQHLQKEDEQLYPELKRFANEDGRLQDILSTFAQEMDDISKFVLDFFNKYENQMDGVNFAEDFGTLVALLQLRISREENILYKEYEKFSS